MLQDNQIIKNNKKGSDKLLETDTLYCMDNLELLKQLDSNSIDLIYCDILYNTGKKFTDYDDRLGTPQEAIEWYRPRLIEMKRALKDTGSIYLQCDYRLVHYLKVEMDSVFGINCFKSDIIWKKSVLKGARVKSLNFGSVVDNILFYTKTKEKYIFNKQFDKSGFGKFNKVDKNGRRYSTDCPIGDYSSEKIEQLEKEGRIHKTKSGKKQVIRYFDEYDGVPLSNLWTHINSINQVAKERVGYDTQKPHSLLETIITTSSNKGDIVADFFMGSGTTCVVAKELGRKYIGCDINQKAIEITKKRLSDVLDSQGLDF